jgi:dihydrofolate synthase/folylpolyglutamate synthase
VARGSQEILAPLEARGVRLDLEPFRSLLAALGHPERAAPALLVAGTNGKGSIAALVERALAAAGYRTLLATSPHLLRPHERIRIAGSAIAEPDLAAALERTLAAATAATAPTYFEALVAAGFLAAAESGVDALVVEVGLGGRLDATNAAEPAVSTVARIALDHTAELGGTLALIAREKAGIFRRGRPAVLAAQEPAAERALAQVAREVGAPLRRARDTVAVAAAEFRGLAGHSLTLETAHAAYRFELPLAGEHQVDNAAAALATAEELGFAAFPRLDPRAIERGFAACRWPGRLETVSLPAPYPTVLLDGAHNPDGCAALARFLARLARPYALLFGALADKQVAAMLPALAAGADAIVLTRAPSPRAVDPAALRPLAARASVEPDPERALARALDHAPGLLVVCGSLYLVGAARAALGRRFGVPPQ